MKRRGEVVPTAGGVAEWLMAADCKSAGLTLYVGSNPTPTTGRAKRTTQARVTDRECAGVAQLVEHQPSKLRVAGSSPVARLTGSVAETSLA